MSEVVLRVESFARLFRPGTYHRGNEAMETSGRKSRLRLSSHSCYLLYEWMVSVFTKYIGNPSVLSVESRVVHVSSSTSFRRCEMLGRNGEVVIANLWIAYSRIQS